MATVICVVSLKRPREFDGLSGQPTTESTETVGGRHLSIITWHFLETALHPRQRPYNFFLFFFSTGGGDRPNGAVWSGGSARQRRGTAFYFHFHTVSTFAAAYHFWRFNRLKISLFCPPPPLSTAPSIHLVNVRNVIQMNLICNKSATRSANRIKLAAPKKCQFGSQ